MKTWSPMQVKFVGNVAAIVKVAGAFSDIRVSLR